MPSTNEQIISEKHESPDRIVTIALDESKYSEHAFHWACDNLLRESDQIYLLSVRPEATAPIMIDAPFVDLSLEYSRIDAKNKQTSHHLIQKFAAILIERNLKVSGIALCGDPREEIVYKVEDVKTDILVIGSRGLGLVKRTLLSSVSDYCVHHCNCTIIVPKLDE